MRRRNYKYLLTLAVGSLLAFGDMSSLSAQETKSDEFTLEEITVTAQKRVENQQKVAIAMDVITSDEIKELGRNNIDDILSNVSNAIINRAADGLRVSLRGISDESSLNSNNQHVSGSTVAVNLDGAFNSSDGAGMNLFDVERVEVLVGPQSTMYASNSPGGIVNVVTAAPKTDKYSANASFEYGSYNLRNVQAAVNAPIVQDKLAIRLAANLAKRDTYLEGGSSTSGTDNKAVRLKTLYQPVDNLSITVTGNWSKNGGGGMGGGQVVSFAKQSDVSNPWTAASGASGPNNSDQTTKGLTGNIEYSSKLMSVTVVPSYSKSSSSGLSTVSSGPPGSGGSSTVDQSSSNEQKGVEVRLASASDFIFKWILGVNYYKSEDNRTMEYLNSTQSEVGINSQESKAIFANITYPVTDKFRVSGGYRKSADTNIVNDIVSGSTSGPGSSYSTTKYNKPDTKLGVEYDLGASSMLYADRATSFRLMGMGMANASGQHQPPEQLTAYTVGSKNRFLNNKLQVNASAYLYQYKNRQANQMKVAYNVLRNDSRLKEYNGVFDSNYDANSTDPYGTRYNTDGSVAQLGNGEVHDMNSQGWGDFRNVGLDISTSWMISTSDKVDLNFSYMHSRWTNLVFNYQYPLFFPKEVFNGQKDTYAPSYTEKLSYTHNFDLWNGGSISARLDATFQSSFILSWSVQDDPYRYQEAHHMLDLSGTYSDPSGKWTLTGYVKNLENYAVKTAYMQMGGLMISDPRTYGGVLSVKF
jgi:iron complex outermembrane recepter protein